MIITTNNKLRLSKIINAWAKRVITLYPTSQEWKTAIISLAVVKLGTMSISAYAAFPFFFDFIYPLIEHKEISKIVTAITLVLLELLTAVFLTKVFKFSFRKMYFTAFLISVVVIGLYSLSFISSTNGLAQKQSSKEDNSAHIKDELLLKKEQLTREQEVNLMEFDRIINDIRANPTEWFRGKRIFLSKEQQNNIIRLEEQKIVVRKTYNTQLEKTDKQFHEKLSINNLTKSDVANKYYVGMAVVIVIQFVVTGILIFFLHQIYFQELVHNTDFKTTHKNTLFTNMHVDETQEYAAHEIKRTNINGHQISGNEEYFKKHKDIVAAILVSIHKNQTFLSNADINMKLLPKIKNVKYKSFSLIRKVFGKMQAFGLINLRDNRNILIKPIKK